MRASYNGYTSAFQADDAGSIPAARSKMCDIAQLVERTLGKGEVGSSNRLSAPLLFSFLFFPSVYCIQKSGMLPG